MLLQVEYYIMKMALAHKVIRNIPDFNEASLLRDEGILRAAEALKKERLEILF